MEAQALIESCCGLRRIPSGLVLYGHVSL